MEMPVAQVELLEHQPEWTASFEALAAELRAALAGLAVDVQHIGSTAVQGLCAKPVIDILLGLGEPAGLAALMSRAPALARAGYVYRPAYEDRLPDRRYFVRDAGERHPRVHLHAVVCGGRLWTDHVNFRDALREDAALARGYAGLKRELALRHADDKAAYTAAKSGFIQAVLAARR